MPASGIAGGKTNFNLSLATSGGAVPTSLQWTMNYSTTDISSLSVAAAGTSVSASKTIFCSNGVGRVTCLAYGMGNSVIADGVMAQVTVNLSPTSNAISTGVQISGTSASDATGTLIASTGAGNQIAIQVPLRLLSLACTPGTINGSGSTSCTISLNGSAPAGGYSVALSSNNTALNVPASVTVQAGSATATFSASAAAIQQNQSATVAASANGITQTAPISLTAPILFSSLQCAPATLASNSSTTCTVTLANAAPAGGSVVTLSGGIAGVLTVPASVTVPANAASASFTASTGTIPSTQAATITGSLNGSSATANLSLTTQAALSSLQCAAGSLASNSSTTCTVTLANAAPAGGAVVTLSGAIANVLTLPGSVTIPANATSASFTASTGSLSSSHTATITASFNGSSQQVNISLNPAVMVSDLLCTASTLASNSSTTCTVTLSGPASAGGTVVALSGAIAKVLTVPASVTVPANAATATFTVSTATIPADQTAAITAAITVGNVRQTAATWIQLTTGTASATISSLQCTAYSITSNASTTCSVTLSAAAPAGGAAISISANNAAVTLPASVTVASGATSASFIASTTLVSASQTVVIITASYNGASLTASLAELPVAVSSVQCAPASVNGGSSSTCTVTIASAAPAAGAVISISANNAAVSMPASLTIPAGATSSTFTAYTSVVTTNQTVSLSALYGGVSQTASLAVMASIPSSLRCAPSTIISGSAATWTVSMSSTVQAAGQVVTLSSSNPNLTVPAQVTVAPGSLTAVFSANAASITADQPAVVTASANGGSQSTSVMLSAPAQLTGLSCLPAKVASGNSATCTATLSKAVFADAVMALSGGNAVLSIPANVTAVAGASTAIFTATASGTTTQTVALTASWNGITVPFSITVAPPPPTFSILGSPAELQGVANGAIITPTYAPAGLTGTVVANGIGSVNFAPNQNGNGVYFQGCCQNNNNAYYKFTGAAVGNIFNFTQGQMAFSLTSRSAMAVRAQASSYRSVVNVRDGNPANHLVSFTTQVVAGNLVFYYNVGSQIQYYYVPRGTENALFGAGVTLQVALTWTGNTLNLYLNGTLVKSSPYTAPTGNWTAASVLDLGAQEYLTYGGYDSCDDVIAEFAIGPVVQT
jgi:hypothetical protein